MQELCLEDFLCDLIVRYKMNSVIHSFMFLDNKCFHYLSNVRDHHIAYIFKRRTDVVVR